MSSYHSHYDEKHLIGNLLSDQDDSFLLHSSGSSQSSAKERSAAAISCNNAVGAVGSEFNSGWPEPPPPYTPPTLFLPPPPPGLPVSTWRETSHNVREENVVDDWSSFLAKKTPSYEDAERGSTRSAPLTAPVHSDNTMPFSYRDALNRGTWQSLANSRHGSSCSTSKDGDKNGEEARMKSSNEEVNLDTRSSKGTSSESRDSFQQITRKKGQQKTQNLNGEGKTTKTRTRAVHIPDYMDPPPIEDNSRFTILDKLPSRRNTSSFSQDDGSFDSRVDRTPMQSTLTKNEKKTNGNNGMNPIKKRWNRKDDRHNGAGIVEHLTILIGYINVILSYTYSIASSVLLYVYELVIDFLLNLLAILRYGVDQVRVEVRVKIHEIRGKANQWWNRRKKEEQIFGLVQNIRVPETAEDALDRLIHARGQDAYSVLGLRADESDEVIKSYYKRQALLVHPDKNKKDGASEAFKILSTAFEVVSTPEKRKNYDTERTMTGPIRKEFNDLYRVLQVKVEETRNRMDCNCGMTHVRVPSKLPQQAARYCRKCDTRHAAKNLDLWAESRFLGSCWVYYTCVNGVVYDVSAWANCSYNQLKHIRADQHNVQYRMTNLKKDKDQKQTADRYLKLLMSVGSNQATLQPIAREEDRPRKARRTIKKK